MKATIRARLLAIFVSAVTGGAASAQTISGSLDGDRPAISGQLSLQKAVDTAVAGNLEVLTMRAEADAAAQETRAMRAMTRPQLSANTYLATSSMPAILGSSPGVMPSNLLLAPAKPFADQNLSLMVPLYTGGRLSSLVKSASKREAAAAATIGTARADAARMVREAYYGALLAVEMAKVAQARLDAATEMVEVARAQFETGKGIQASVSRAQAEEADARRMVTAAKNDQAKMMLELKRAMGVRLDSEIILSDALDFVQPAEDLAASLADAAKIRPELIAARARVEAARAQTAAAKGAFQPQVYGTAMADAFVPGDMGKYTGATVGLTMSIPLFDAGQRRAEVGQMDAMRRREEAALKDLELRVAMEVRQARLDVETAGQNYRTAQAALVAAQDAYDVVVLRVQNQRSIFVEQLDALAALTQARTNVAQALYDHSTAVARLRRAVGRE